MFIDILSGMMELHSRYIIHRDIKLKNIFIDKELRCVIGDLGIATKSVDYAKSSVGTVGMAAPEVYAEGVYN
jgi:serine/threonine protein kinase